MADSPPPPPPAPTTITALGDDMLREIFLRLPDVASLARAAFACGAFLHAVSSSPAFRRRFRELHAPPLLALFLMPDMRAIVPAAAGKSSNIATAFDCLFKDSDSSESEWRSEPEIPYICGYARFVNRAADQGAFYNPHSQALNIYPKMARNLLRNLLFGTANCTLLEFHTLSQDGEEKQPSRVVCVHRDGAWAWARVAVFSLQTKEWRVVLPQMDTGRLLVDCDKDSRDTGTVVNGFVCWIKRRMGCILALNTVTFEFSRMELPPPLKVQVPFSLFQLGHTKDGKFCIVSELHCILSVWLWAADGDGVERFILHKTFSLQANFSKITKLSEEAHFKMLTMAVINGFVYLSAYLRGTWSHKWFLSLCLETYEMNLLFKETLFSALLIDPYIMVSWPSSLINGKKDSETGVTGNISEDDGHMGTKEASAVLFTALQSFKEKLIDDGNLNFTEIDSFLLDDGRNSLLNRIATLESGLAAAREHVLRLGTVPNSMSGMELVTSESELAGTRDPVLRIATESNSTEGMERVSCWQMCKGILGRACS